MRQANFFVSGILSIKSNPMDATLVLNIVDIRVVIVACRVLLSVSRNGRILLGQNI